MAGGVDIATLGLAVDAQGFVVGVNAPLAELGPLPMHDSFSRSRIPGTGYRSLNRGWAHHGRGLRTQRRGTAWQS